MQSVASISPIEPRSTPAPDRKNGDGSFSSLLDTTAQQPDNPAPEAGPSTGPSTGNDTPPLQGKTKLRPNEDHTARPGEDPGNAKAPCKQAGTDAAKNGDATAEEKHSGKGSKKSAGEDGAEDAGQAVVTPDPAKTIPQSGVVAAVMIAADVPKAEGDKNVPTGGDCAKPADVEMEAEAAIAAAAGAKPAALVAPGTPATPESPEMAASGAPKDGKPMMPMAPAAKDSGAQVASAIEAAAKGAASEPNNAPTESDDTAETLKLPRSGAIAALTEKAAPEAAKVAAVIDLGARGDTGKPSSGDLPQPAPTNVDAGKALGAGDPASVHAAAKAAPNPGVPAGGTQQELEAGVRDLSPPQLAQSTALPESLRLFSASLTPVSMQGQVPGASAQAVPLTSAAIAIEIAARAKEGSHQFDIRLDPPELGRIDVRLDVGKGGEVNTRLTADRPETLQLLQNDARGLERALQSAGLKTEDGSLQFSLRQQSPDSGGQTAQGGAASPSATVYVDEEELTNASLEQYQWAARLRGGVDIRI